MATKDLWGFGSPDLDEPTDERWALVQRIASSPSFMRAPHLRGFLLFVASRAVAERFNEINEYEIGRVGLGRQASFNPYEDNIVRVQARHLRLKLAQYFETEGKDEPVVVTIPKGTYVPAFEPRHVPDEAVQPEKPGRRAWGLDKRRILLSVSAVLVACTIWVAATHGYGRTGNQAGPNPLVSRVFLSGDSVKIVVSDASLVLLQRYLHRSLTLSDYLQSNYPHALLAPMAANGETDFLERASRGDFAAYVDIVPATRLVQFGQAYRAKAIVRHPRQLNIHDFETSSFVLLGGPVADPWYKLFEPHLNFVFEVDDATGGASIRNKVPARNELPAYVPVLSPNAVDFALIAMLPNLRRSGRVLLLAGTSAGGTSAATEMVTRDPLSGDLLNIMNQSKNQDDTIEILLQTSVAAGVPLDSKIVAYRIRQTNAQR